MRKGLKRPSLSHMMLIACHHMPLSCISLAGCELPANVAGEKLCWLESDDYFYSQSHGYLSMEFN